MGWRTLGLPSDPFAGCWDRLDRARTHRAEALEAWSSFLDEDPYDSRLVIDSSGSATLSIIQSKPPPRLIALAVGEYFYQVRAALDNLVFTVAAFDSGQYPPPKAATIQFPACASEAAWNAGVFRLEALSERHRSWLYEIQPFHSHSLPSDRTVLHVVNDLARRDRHRELHVAAAHATEVQPIVNAPSADAVFWKDVPPRVQLDDEETAIAEFSVVPYAPGDTVEANPNLMIDLEVVELAALRSDEGGTWLDLPLGERFLVIEFFMEGFIGRFERDLVGHTRAKGLRDEADLGTA